MGKMKARSEETHNTAQPCCADENYNNTCTCGIQEPSDAELSAIEVDLDYQVMLSEFEQEVAAFPELYK